MNHSLKAGLLAVALATIGSTGALYAHCDTMDGPLIKDAQAALGSRNVNHVLKWVGPENRADVVSAFTLSVKVGKQGKDARELADRYFFDTLVRLHRAEEGVPFTGVKPKGWPVDERVAAADDAIALGNLKPLEGLVPPERWPELAKRYERVMALKNFNVDDVDAGREYIEAYVMFFKYAEGEDEGHHAEPAGVGSPTH